MPLRNLSLPGGRKRRQTLGPIAIKCPVSVALHSVGVVGKPTVCEEFGRGDGSFGSGRITLRQVGRFEPNGYRLNLYDFAGSHVGKFYHHVCVPCGRGWIGKIAVYAGDQQGTGLGRRLLVMAREAHPGLQWSTSAQHPSAVGFWRRMADELGERYDEVPVPRHCGHGSQALSVLHEAVVRYGN